MKKLLILFLVFYWSLFGDIGGVVFKDFNLNGLKDSEDSGLSNIPLKATCDDGNIYSTTSGDDGVYTFILNSNIIRCRIEADPTEAGFGSAENGQGGVAAPLVSFSTNGNLEHNISIASPATYCQDKPDVLMAALPGGNDGDTGNPENHGVLFSLPTPDIGVFDDNYSKRTLLQTRSDLGAIWGIAYKKSTKTVYAASVIKRYIPLLHGCSDEDNNSNGCAGRIYKITDGGTGAVEILVDLGNNEVGYTGLTEARNYDGESTQKDQEVVDLIGRAGFGDLDISEDEKYLYTINLYTKQLIKIDAESGAIIFKKDIPNPYGSDCNSSMVRPWALKVLGKDVYIGSVCEDKISNGYPTDSSTDHSSELGAAIQKFDGTNFTLFAKTNTLNYLKPRTWEPEKAEGPTYDQNNNWSWYGDGNEDDNQPMLTDIEFSNSGDLILGYTDRGAFDRVRGNSSGDVRKMCRNADGTYTDESTAVAPTNCSSHTVQYLNDSQDNTQTYYEFYRGDYFDYNQSNVGYGYAGHPETASGALAMKPGDSSIYVGMVDGTASYEPGSLGFYDNATGDKVAAQELINRASIDDDPDGEREMYGSKAGGMGDLELLCDPAPIEIGDYVWSDLDGDGVQDANEPGLANIKVELHSGTSCSGTLIGEATTNIDGYFYFGGINSINLNSGEAITPDTNYSICIPLNDQTLLNMKITTQNATDDTIDSDIYDDGNGYAKIDVTTKAYGDNNHNFDAGFHLASIGDKVWIDNNYNGVQDSGESGVAGVTINLYDSSGNKIKTTTTDADGKYRFLGLDAGDYYVEFNLSTLPIGYKVTTKDAGRDDTIDSDADPTTGKTATITLDAGEDDLSWDMGIYKPTYCIGDFVWNDTNKNGIQDSGENGVSGVQITLEQTGATTTTDSNGKYEFCGLNDGNYSISVSLPNGYVFSPANQGGDDSKDSDINPNTNKSDTIEIKDANNTSLDIGMYQLTYCLGDFVWNDTNKNGIQDSDESGISNVAIDLYDDSGNKIASTTTGSDGKYEFCGLSDGSYTLKITPPTEYKLSPINEGSDDNKDSDFDPDTKETTPFKINGDNIFSIDAGLYKDVNNIKVEIDIEKHLNGKDADTLSDAVALLDNQEFEWEYIVSNIGEDTIIDIKVVDDKEGEINCPKTTLAPGTQMTCILKGKAQYEKYESSVTVTGKGESSLVTVTDRDSNCYVTKYEIGTHFWIDTNGDGIYQEGSEKPVANALIELFDTDGKKIAQTYTNSNGEYHFYVPAGSYYVKFHLPETLKEQGYTFEAPQNNRDNNLNINNVDFDGISKLVTVGPDADPDHQVADLTLDAGVVCGCESKVSTGSGDALNRNFALIFILFTILIGIREVQKRRA